MSEAKKSLEIQHQSGGSSHDEQHNNNQHNDMQQEVASEDSVPENQPTYPDTAF